MIVTENECVGCPPDMGCIGTSCPYWAVTRLYCDECDDEAELYWFEDEQLCIDCIIKRLERVEIDD
jgi:hypothetical protein